MGKLTFRAPIISPFIMMALLGVCACNHGGSGADGLEQEGVVSAESLVSENDNAPGAHTPGRPWTNPIGRYDEVFNDSNYLQYMSAERLGIDPIITLYDAYNTSRPLVRIESGDTYEVDELTHSMPFLVPEAADLLDEIGAEFGETLRQRGGDPEHTKIIVTSLLRSRHTVKKLRRVNRNAVDSSTHMFGTTFDIAWNKFHTSDSLRGNDEVVLKGILAEVLLKKRNEGKCLVKYEKKTPCFHITVK